MRMLLEITIPAAKGNQAIADGTFATAIQRLIETHHPEAVYFFTPERRRGGFIVFDLADPSEIPAIAEPLFQALDAEISFSPVMNQADLTKGLAALG